MNTQKIRILLTALEEGSLTKAGEKLGYTQSGASWIIRSLEEELGVPLLIRTNGGVEASSEAKEMLPTFREILSGEEKLTQQSDAFRGLRRGTIRIGSFISTSMHWLPDVIGYFQKNAPEVQIRINECGQQEMIDGILDGSMDAALMSDPHQTGIEFVPLLEDPMVVAFSEPYDFSGYDAVSADDLRNVPVFTTEADYDMDAQRVLEDAGITPDSRYTSKDDFAVLSMVQHGLGVAVLPELVISGFPDAIEYRLIRPETYRTLGVGLRSVSEAGPLVQFFLQYLKEHVR